MKQESSAKRLIEELQHNAVASGNRVLERRLADLTVWFYHNRQRIPEGNLGKKIEFLEKSLWISFEVMALLLERHHEVTALKKEGSMLWLPRGMTINGQEKEFG